MNRNLFNKYYAKFAFVEDKNKLIKVLCNLLHLTKIKRLPKEILYDFLNFDFNPKLVKKDPRCLLTYFKQYLNRR